MSLVGPYLAACLVLVAAAGSKALRPADTATALGRLVPGLPRRVLLVAVRAIGAGEAGLGVAGLLWPRPALAAAVAATYAVFAGFVAMVRVRHGALASCGCFGTPDVPATGLHVVIDLTLAVTAATVATTAGPRLTLIHLLARSPAHGAVLLVLSATLAGLVVGALGTLARLSGIRLQLAGAGLSGTPSLATPSLTAPFAVPAPSGEDARGAWGRRNTRAEPAGRADQAARVERAGRVEGAGRADQVEQDR